jgi:hypothetical protein
MGFPQFANIDNRIYKTMVNRAGNNKEMSELQPWIRVTSTLHKFLTLESIKNVESFTERYGDTQKSGRVGTDKNGASVYAGNERAFRPSPTISSLNISQGNEGLSKKASFTITAYTKGQAELIINYFMEPGVHCLIEFGFNQNQSVSQKCQFGGSVETKSGDIEYSGIPGYASYKSKESDDTSATCEVIRYKNIAYVREKRKRSNGTYDAMLAIITGGNTNFGDNESYNIDVECTSIGELPAYLQHHKNIQTTNGKSPIQFSKRFPPEEFSDYGDDDKGSAVEIGKSLFKQMFNELPAHKRMKKVRDLVDQKWATNPSNFVNMDKEIRTTLTEEVKSGMLALTSNENLEQLSTEISSNGVTEKATAQQGEDAKKSLQVSLSDDNTKTGIGDNVVGKIPSDQPLFSDRRYIKVALAFTILEMQPNTSDEIPVICQNGSTVSPLYINWQDTICKGHKHMYSVDPNTLYVPNKHHPRFRIEGAFVDPVTEIKEGKESITAFTNPIPNLLVADDDGKNVTFNEGPSVITDMHPNTHDDFEGYSYFPSNTPLKCGSQENSDASFNVVEANAFNWGYLRNLYIDFDFFIQTIQQNSYLSKDILYTLLNGLSGGVNMMWDFQIVEQCSIDYNQSRTENGNDKDDFYQWYSRYIRGATDESGPMPGQEELAVVDLSFFGKQTPTPSLGIAGFQSRGLKSPFLSATLKFDIPSAMKGQITAQRRKGGNTQNPNLEQKDKNFKQSNDTKEPLFSYLTDSVGEMIYHFNNHGAGKQRQLALQKQEEQRQDQMAKEGDSDAEYNEAVEAEGPWYKKAGNWISETYQSTKEGTKKLLGFDTEKVGEVRNANYEMVLGNANVIPSTQDRKANLDLIQGFADVYTGNNTTLDKVAKVSAWKDTQILKIISDYDARDANAASKQHSIILPIEFEFEIPGISGFKMGDTFTIIDLPKKQYCERYFQVVEVSHQIEQSIWKTKIRGAMRNEKSGYKDGVSPKTYDDIILANKTFKKIDKPE